MFRLTLLEKSVGDLFLNQSTKIKENKLLKTIQETKDANEGEESLGL
jgi:hypothetical protein